MYRSLILSLLLSVMNAVSADSTCPPMLQHTVRSLNSENRVDLCKAYAGKVLLIVNTASQCGYTGQLKGLETLYQTYRQQGFEVLGFPSDSFKQEHADERDTEKVARKDYGVSFPLFEKQAVNGSDASGLFKELAAATGKPPQWNFQKYLVDRKGKVIGVYPSQVTPDDLLLKIAIEGALQEP